MSAVTLAGIGLGLATGSQIMGGVTAHEESKAMAKAYAANAEIATKQAANQAAIERDKYRRLAASQRASYGASGVDVNVGSPLDVLADTDAEGVVSAMQLLYGGELEAANWRLKSQLARYSGQTSRAGGILGGLSTGFMGAARLFGS